jgi:hypothetical protein
MALFAIKAACRAVYCCCIDPLAAS